MQVLCDEIIKFKINSYLSIQDKIKLKHASKKFGKIQNITINYHIGEFIGNFIGLSKDKKDMEDEGKIIKQISYQLIKEISDFLDCPKNTLFRNYGKKSKYYQYPVHPVIGVLFRINNSSRQECIDKLNTKNIFRKSDRLRKNGFSNNVIKSKFRNVYSLLI